VAATLEARGMIFDQQLRMIVAAVAFVAPDRARITGMRGGQRDIVVTGQGYPGSNLGNNTVGGLTYALYADWYSALPSEAASAPAPAASAAEFLASLQAANPIPYRYEDGWTVARADAGGVWIVNALQQQRFAALNEIVPLAGAVAPGMPVRLVPLRGMVTGPAGHYLISGRPIFDPQTGRQVRFYWNVAASGAAALLREIGARLERRRIPFQAKVPVDPALYPRTDCGVLYLNDEDVEAASDAIAATHGALRGHLRSAVPLFTRELAPGLGFAESPPTRESFGMHRCALVAEGLLWAEQRGARELEARLAVVRERLTGYGLDLDRLERNPTSRYPYRLDTLFLEQAA
jgi:class II lanthipeptide synthase